MHPKVIEAITPFLKDDFGNPSNLHQFGMATGVDAALAQGTVLFSLGIDNSGVDVKYVLEKLPPTVKRLREKSPLYHQRQQGR